MKKEYLIREQLNQEYKYLSSVFREKCAETLKTNSEKKLEKLSKEILELDHRREAMKQALDMYDELYMG